MLTVTPIRPPWPSWLSDAPWPPHIMPAIGCDDRGVVVGSGTQLVRMGDKGRLAVEPDAARCIALLSVLSRKPVAAEVLRPIEAAAAYWAAGDKALANLRLVFSGLPKLRSATDAACLEAAAWCLDQGLAPCDLMKALDLDPSVLDLRKYDPDQPRVPAGSGRESGRWTGQPDAGTIGGNIVSSTSGEIRIAANGPFKPDGIEANPSQPIDPLDPANLNKLPPTPQEQQAIANALSIIMNGTPEEIKKLQPHPYQNLPEKSTGAMLPPDPQGYTSYNATSGAERGQARVVVNGSNTSAYYTSNHYKSFFGVNMVR